MKRNHTLLLASAVALGLGLPAAAVAADSGFYVGGLIGASSYDIKVQDVGIGTVDLTPLTGGVPASFTIDSNDIHKTDTAFGATLGYRFMKFVAVELSYLDLGKGKIDAAGSYQYADSGVIPFTGHLEMKSRGPAAAVVGILPFGENWAVDARVGAYFGKTEYTVTLTDPTGSVSGSESKSNSHLMAGVGLGYTFGQNWELRVDYLYLNKVGDKDIYQTNVNVGTVGLRYKF